MRTVLITGCAGFIGSNLARELLAEGYRVVGVDNFNEVYDPKFKEEHIAPLLDDPDFSIHRFDITDKEEVEALFRAEKPDMVAHLAARADTRAAVEDPSPYIETNIRGTYNLLEAARENGNPHMVIASSSSVYGNSTAMPLSEDAPADRPLSPYGATKRSVELFAHAYHYNFDMSVTCLRYFNAYGENNRPGMVPYKWAQALLRGEEIEISGDGSRKRDYTYVGDTVAGTIAALKKPLGYQIINIGNNNPVSLNELLAAFEETIGVKAKVLSRDSTKPSVEATYADIEKARTLLGWEPATPLKTGIEKLVTWVKANRL